MCEPTTISMVMMGIAAAGAVAQQDAQRKQVNTQQDALKRQAEDDANTRGLQMAQVSEAAAKEANDRNKAAREEAAVYDAIAGEYGGGVSAERQSANVMFNRDNDLSTVTANKDRQLSQLGHEGSAAGFKYQSQLASLNRPSTLGTALKIAGSAASSYSGSASGTSGNSTRTDGWSLSKTNRGSGD